MSMTLLVHDDKSQRSQEASLVVLDMEATSTMLANGSERHRQAHRNDSGVASWEEKENFKACNVSGP